MSKLKRDTEIEAAQQDAIKKGFSVNYATNQAPSYTIDQNKKIIKQGDKNNYSEYLLFLYDNQSEHGSIVDGKTEYITGLNITSEDANAQEFLKRANPLETWQDIRKKYLLDRTLQGGYYLKIETNTKGEPINWYHVPYCQVRRTSDFKSFSVSNDQNAQINRKETIYPEYRKGYVGTSIYFCKRYSPVANKLKSAYPHPEYMNCTLDIDTDVRVGTFFNNYVRKSFSSGTVIIIRNGETDPAKKKNIVDRIKAQYTSEDEAGEPVVIFAGKDDTNPAEIVTVNNDNLDKKYQELSKRNKEKIVAGHRIPAPLFKIRFDDKAMSTRSELVEMHELFMNEYVLTQQEEDIKNIAKWYLARTGLVAEFEIEQVKLIGLELPLDNPTVVNALDAKDPNIILKYISDKYGLKIDIATTPEGAPLPIKESTKPNEVLKGLSAKENQDLIRIVRDFTKGRLNEAMAMARIRAYGIDDVTAKQVLGIDEATVVQQASHDKNKRIEELFLKYAHDIVDDEVLETVSFPVNFATATEVSVTELRNAILNQLKGNPYATVPELATSFKVDVTVIEENIKWLNEKALIEVGSGTMQPTEKAMSKDTETEIETEIYTEYTYQLRPDLKGQPVLLPTSRDDCRKWYALTRTKAITFEAIGKLTNEFGEEAWQFRGGFYNNKGEVTPWCRHIWQGETKIRRKKK